MAMVLIDRGGRRVREVCRECGKVHRVKDCPERLKEQARIREFCAYADAFREWARRQQA